MDSGGGIRTGMSGDNSANFFRMPSTGSTAITKNLLAFQVIGANCTKMHWSLPLWAYGFNKRVNLPKEKKKKKSASSRPYISQIVIMHTSSWPKIDQSMDWRLDLLPKNPLQRWVGVTGPPSFVSRNLKFDAGTLIRRKKCNTLLSGSEILVRLFYVRQPCRCALNGLTWRIKEIAQKFLYFRRLQDFKSKESTKRVIAEVRGIRSSWLSVNTLDQHLKDI